MRDGITSVNIPYGVTQISRNTFTRTGLTAVTIPDSVTLIEASAFWGCEELKTITFMRTTPRQYWNFSMQLRSGT